MRGQIGLRWRRAMRLLGARVPVRRVVLDKGFHDLHQAHSATVIVVAGVGNSVPRKLVQKSSSTQADTSGLSLARSA